MQQLARDYRDLVDAEYALVVDGGGGVLNDAGEAIQFQVGFAENLRHVCHDCEKPRWAQLYTRADNAIYDLARAIQRLEAYASRWKPARSR